MSVVDAIRVGGPAGSPLPGGLRLYGSALIAGMALTVTLVSVSWMAEALWTWVDPLLSTSYLVQDVLLVAALLRIAAGLTRGRVLVRGACVVAVLALVIDLIGFAGGPIELTYVIASVLQSVAAIALLSALRLSARAAGRPGLGTWCLVLQLGMVPATAGLLAAMESTSFEVWAAGAVASVIPWLAVAMLCLRAAIVLPPARSARR